MFTKAEMKRRWYEKHKENALSYQKAYYQKHKEELRKKANERYRIKCGLKAKDVKND